MKHFNWDCECKDCMIMKSAPDMIEVLRLIRYEFDTYNDIHTETRDRMCVVINKTKTK